MRKTSTKLFFMFSLIIFIAIANFCLGLLLGWNIHGFGPSRTMACVVVDTVNQNTSSLQFTKGADCETVADEQTARQFQDLDALPVSHDGLALIEKEAQLSPIPAEATAVEISDSKRQLQQAKENIRYVRSTQDKGLAKEIAARLRTMVLTWQAQLQQCLDDSVACETNDPSFECPDAISMEMCLAQIESSISNIDAINWMDEAHVILDGIERETELIAKSQLL